MRFEELKKGDAESGVSSQSCDQTQSRRNPYMALQILKNNDFNLCWIVNGLSILSSVANFTPAHTCKHGHVLSPGRYVGAADVEDDDMPFADRFASLKAKLNEQFVLSDQLTATIRARIECVVVDE